MGDDVELGVCKECGRTIRPHGAPAEDWPDTVARYRSDLCHGCEKRIQRTAAARFDAPFPGLDGTQACADKDPELFFPHDSDDPEPAKAVCRTCPLVHDCLAFALSHPVEGVWGATTADERRELRSRHGIQTTSFTDWRFR